MHELMDSLFGSGAPIKREPMMVATINAY